MSSNNLCLSALQLLINLLLYDIRFCKINKLASTLSKTQCQDIFATYWKRMICKTMWPYRKIFFRYNLIYI